MAVRRVAVPTFDPDMDGGRTALTVRQRFALTRGVVDPGSVVGMADSEFDVVFMRSKNVPIANVRAAGMTATDLKMRGCPSAMALRELGYDALDLCDAGFTSSCVAAFGADDVKRVFLVDAGDAVALAGSTATMQLEIPTSRLVETCAGASDAARAVLQQLPRGVALSGVSPGCLLDCGLRAGVLMDLGYFRETVAEQTGAGSVELKKLGF